MKKLTITIDDDVYKGLQATIGRGKISRFLNNMARPYVVVKDMDAGYAAMAADEKHAKEALVWAEIGVHDLAHEK